MAFVGAPLFSQSLSNFGSVNGLYMSKENKVVFIYDPPGNEPMRGVFSIYRLAGTEAIRMRSKKIRTADERQIALWARVPRNPSSHYPRLKYRGEVVLHQVSKKIRLSFNLKFPTGNENEY